MGTRAEEARDENEWIVKDIEAHNITMNIEIIAKCDKLAS